MTLLLSLAISTAFLGDPSCVPNDPTDCRQTVTKGEVVPFDGQLLSPRRAAKLAVRVGQCQERIAAEVAEVAELMKIDLRLEKQLRANDSEHANRQRKLLEAELVRAHEAAEPSFLEHPALWFAFGVVATVAAVGITIAVIDATRPQVVFVPPGTTSTPLKVAW